MYRASKIALVIPAHNEERLLPLTLSSVPGYFDRIYVINDGSTDGTEIVIKDWESKDNRVTGIRHAGNLGPGGSIISGYLASLRDRCDVTVVVGGDNQMQISEAGALIDPIIDQLCDYSKGNRFFKPQLGDTLRKMPFCRIIANGVLTLMVRLCTQYRRVGDVVDGYTAISRSAIGKIRWEDFWMGYGYPIDFLLRFSSLGIRILDVPRTAVYLKGERQSQILPWPYLATVGKIFFRHLFTHSHSMGKPLVN